MENMYHLMTTKKYLWELYMLVTQDIRSIINRYNVHKNNINISKLRQLCV